MKSKPFQYLRDKFPHLQTLGLIFKNKNLLKTKFSLILLQTYNEQLGKFSSGFEITSCVSKKCIRNLPLSRRILGFMSLKAHFLHSHLDFFPGNLEAKRKFPQFSLQQLCQGFCNYSTMTGYCHILCLDIPDWYHRKRKSIICCPPAVRRSHHRAEHRCLLEFLMVPARSLNNPGLFF